MNKSIISSLLAALFRLIPEDGVRIAIGAMLHKIKEFVKKTPNKIDDNIIPLCDIIERQLNIPDEDTPKVEVTTTTKVTPPTP